MTADIPLVYLKMEVICFLSSHQSVMGTGLHWSRIGFACSFMRVCHGHTEQLRFFFLSAIERVEIQFMALMIYITFESRF